jgi:ubiquinone/menaquinone biosynthesis C-methylase UbiE
MVENPVPAENFIPALKFRILTPLYDIFLRVVMKEIKIKSRLIAQLNPNDTERILDFGCGTGTLTLMIKKAGSGCDVYGIDIDPQVLEIAEKKARYEMVDIHVILYNGITLPFTDEIFDKVVISLVVHHLSKEERPRLFRELYRVLKKGGELHILDFGIQRSLYTRLITSVLKFFEPIKENLLGKIPEYLKLSCFKDVEEVNYENTLIGTVSFYRSKK